MRLVRQVCLQFVGGNSRKAYEVDLCDVGDGKFVVNFRYGRMGTNLRDGTKTAAPVDEAKATQLFDKLVAEKTAKGYTLVEDRDGATGEVDRASAPPPAPPRPVVDAGSLDARRARVLEALAAGESSGRRMGRLARSAAELEIEEAVPLLLRALQTPAPSKEAKPLLRLVRGPAPPPRPTNMGTVTSFVPMDSVGRLRTETGEELRFGGSACQGFVPFEGQEVVYDLVDDHPLGGRRAKKVSLSPEDAAKRAAQQAADREAPQRHKEDRAVRGRRMDRYNIVWSLGRLADPRAFEALANIYLAETGEPTPVARVAGYGALRCGSDPQAEAFLQSVRAQLPDALRAALEDGGSASVGSALLQHLKAHPDGAGHRALDQLHLGGADAGRQAVMRWLRDVKLEPPAFQRVRHLFKAAELQEDWELFGLIAYKIDTTRALYTTPSYGGRWVWYQKREYLEMDKEMIKPDPRLAYSSNTRWYFRRAIWRTLRRIGHKGMGGYVRAAVGILSPYSDSDAKPVKTSERIEYGPGGWEDRRSVVTDYDRFAGYRAFNHILYSHSPRYELPRGIVTWRCRQGYEPGDPPPAEREEAFPELWDAQPVGLLHLLTSSSCTPVLVFATRSARANKTFFEALEDEPLAALLARPHPLPSRWGWELARPRLEAGPPSLTLLVGLLLASVAEARAAGLAALTNVTEEQDRQVLVGRAVAALTSLSAEDDAGAALALVEALAEHLGSTLSGLGPDVLRDLLSSPSVAAQQLAVEAMKARGSKLVELPADLILLPLGSEHPQVRSTGVQMLGLLGADDLAERLALLRDLLRSPHAEVRQAAGPLVGKVVTARPDLGADLATLLCSTLLNRELHPGVHADVLGHLRGPLAGALEHLPPATVWRLIASKQKAAQDLGGELLKTHVDPASVEIRRLARLCSHELLSVREGAWSLSERSLDRLRADLPEAVRLLDAKWEDSRSWAMKLFVDHLIPDDIDVAPVGVLIGICDSIKPDVQSFGRALVQRHFADTMGPDLLEKLSEHPSGSLQLFVTTLLERFCGEDDHRLVKLEPYFVTVLARVNRGGVTKARVYAFLHERAGASQAAAQVVARILNRQSATLAVTDKARTIETLCLISERWPKVKVAVQPVIIHPDADPRPAGQVPS